MLPPKRILFPVDYSDHCRSVVPYVQEMVGHFSAQPTLVHAYGVGALRYAERAVADPRWPERMFQGEELELREFAAQMFPGLHADCVVEEGEPGLVIEKIVRHQGTDLVMMPTHGLGPLRRLLLGSVTAKVLHDVTTAVWTGAGRMVDSRPRRHSYESILCAVDLSDESEAVIRAAAAFADSFHARLSLVHVVELPPPSFDADFTPFKKEIIDADNERLQELKNKLGIDASHTCMDGITADCVCQEAIQKKADLIVVGRGRAHGALSRIWSRLYTIVRESPCPVLSI